jgi:spore maturation protein CgeB
LPFGVDLNAFSPKEPSERYAHEVAYVGNDIKGNEATMRYLYPAVDFEFGLYGNWKFSRAKYKIWKNWLQPPYKKVFEKISQGRIPQEDVPLLYSSAKINLNCTLQSCIDWDVITLRTYEVLACKGFLITDIVPVAQETMPDCMIFTEGGAHLKEQIAYYLSRDNERRQIAQAGYEYVVHNASVEARARELMEYIRKG